MNVRMDDATTKVGSARHTRVDFQTLGKTDGLERTPTGGIRVPARIARTGVLVYQRQDGSVVREYRSPEEAFRASTLASIEDAVVTVGHPVSQLVTPTTARQYSVGHVRGPGRRDGQFVAAELAVLDASAISAIDGGALAEISAGYSMTWDPTPGVSPEGERYDGVQRDVSYNHVALLPVGAGRAGRDVALRLDGLEVVPENPTETRTDSMEEMIDGKKYVVGSPEWAAASARRQVRRDAELEAATASSEESRKKLDAAVAARDAVQASLDAANATIAALRKDLGEATDETKMDARIAARGALFAQAQTVLGKEAKLDGKTSDAIRREVIVKLDGDAILVGPDGKARDAAYVEVYFTGRMSNVAATTPDATSKARLDAFGASTTSTHRVDPTEGFAPDFASR